MYIEKKEILTDFNADFYDEQGKEILTKHHVEENKFDNFKSAELFFKNCGFEVYKKIDIPITQLNAVKLLDQIPEFNLSDMGGKKRMRETWVLKPSTQLGNY